MKLFLTSKKQLVFLLLAFVTLLPAINTFTGYASPAHVGFADAQIRFGHFAPFNDGDAAIRVKIGDIDRVDNFIYGWSTKYDIALVAGEYPIEIFEADGDESLLKSDTLTFEAGKKYTVLFIGNGVDQPFEVAVIDDDIIMAEPGAAAIAFGHFAPLSGILTGTSIDIREDNNLIVRDNLVYGEFDPSDTDQLIKTKTSYIVTSASGAREFIDLQTFGYNVGDVQYLLLVGDGRNKRIRAYMYVNDGNGGFMTTDKDSAVFVSPSIAFANFYNDDNVSTIQYEFSDSTSGSLEWGEVSIAAEYPTGDYTITFRDADGELILTEEVSIGLSETVVYALTKNDTDGTPLLVPVFGEHFESGIVPPHIRFVHLSPFATGTFATLDVRQSNGLLVEDDLGYGESGEFRAVSPGEYTFNFTSREGDRVLFDLDPMTLSNGDNVTIFLIGDGTSQLIHYVTYVNKVGTLSEKSWSAPFSKLALAHFAPNAVGSATQTRVVLNSNNTLASGFAFGEFHSAETVFSGQHLVEVFDESSGVLLASRVIRVDPATIHSLILTGDNVHQPYEIAFYEHFDDETVSSANTRLRFGNFAIIPDNGSEFDGSEVNLFSAATGLFSGLAYGDFPSGVTSNRPPDTYEFTYVDANQKEIPENPFEITLTGGDNVILFSVGDGNRQPYGLFAMEADGSDGRLLADVENDSFTLYFPIMSTSDE